MFESVKRFAIRKMRIGWTPSMRTLAGIGLLEGIIYLSCSMLFITLAGRLVLEVQSSVRLQTAMNERMVELAVALDRICKLIGAAPAEKALWKVTDESSAVYRFPEGDRAIAMENGRVISISGSYDRNNRVWRKRSSSVLLERATLSLTYHYTAGTMQGVTILLHAVAGKKGLSLKTFVATKRSEEFLEI